MTLVVAETGPESIWLLADRRVTYEDRPPRDDSCKIMLLDTSDGLAILGYCGLGDTAKGTEPSAWMSNVLRGRPLLLERSLEVLGEAIKKHLPPHLVRMPGEGVPAHNVVVPAFIGDEPRFYSIDLQFAPDRKTYAFRCTRHVFQRSLPAKPRPPRLGVGGSGARYLLNRKKWKRELLKVVGAYDHGRISAQTVAGYLAELNYEVSRNVASVGQRCIVAWRNRKNGAHGSCGGSHQFYTKTTPDAASLALPAIANGMDMRAFLDVVTPYFIEMFDASRRGDSPKGLNEDRMNIDLARLPEKPDETLL
jgi:hypothetical protein